MNCIINCFKKAKATKATKATDLKELPATKAKATTASKATQVNFTKKETTWELLNNKQGQRKSYQQHIIEEFSIYTKLELIELVYKAQVTASDYKYKIKNQGWANGRKTKKLNKQIKDLQKELKQLKKSK